MEIDNTINKLRSLGINESTVQTGKNELEALAHAIVDLEKAGDKVCQLCSRINQGSFQTSEELKDILLDIQLELGHILYHISDSDYLSHVLLPYKEVKND